ncbi:MAG: NAD(P)/FAD-dependent oxidoreductase [Candidatus Methanoperedens sp.]|nr:NAD(P)/FAD-dependent oxidoreductase [Candidatus Methanoperedens sp.]
MKDEYDVIVVGAGPAGSITAQTVAEKGYDVLLIEKRQEIGDPVRCAEGCSKDTVSPFIDLDPRWISAEVEGARVFAPDGTLIPMGKDSNKPGIVLERKIFDRALAQNASKSGAEVVVKTSALGLLKKNGSITGIRARSFGEEMDIRSKIVVGADGIESKVGRWAGIDTTLELKDIETCAQFLMTDIDIDPDFCDFFVGNNIAPGGYAWVFPKGNKMANVGIGVVGSRTNEMKPIDCLNKFVKERFPEGKAIELIVGGVPLSRPIERTVGNGILLVGDAARQSDPITGGGIYNSLRCAKIAGDVIAEAFSMKDYSRNTLNKYEKEWRETIGKSIEKNYRIKELFMKMTDKQLNDLARSLDGMNFNEMGTLSLIKQLIKNNPKVFFELRSLF